MSSSSSASSVAGLVVRMVVVFVVYTALLFGAAGTLRWPQAWLYVTVLVLVLAAYVSIVNTKHPDLIAERARPPADAKRWDRPLVAIIAGVGPLAMLLAAGFECRYRGGPGEFSVLPWTGVGLVGAAGALTNWAVSVNRFFSGVVRIQHDRGHVVVDSGPYAWVRHPAYTGSLLNNFGASAALQSRWALVVAIVLLVVTIVRTALEDRTLRTELDGYEDYARRVRFRLAPGIW